MSGIRPLDGMLVLDFAQLIGGPAAAMILADLGAEVIKVEPPGGDSSRQLRGSTSADGSSAMYEAFNRGKRCMCVDLRHSEARAAVLELVERADVVIEASRPGVMARLGLGLEACRDRNPRLVHASLTGFGSSGPDRDRGGVDLVVQAESGIMSVTGAADGPPTKVGFTVVDVAAGNVLAQAVLAALLRRERTGLGAAIEVSLLDVALHLQSVPLTEFLASGVVPTRCGNAAPMTAPADLLRTADGHIVISAYIERHWRALCAILDRHDLVTDHRFCTVAARVENRSALIQELEAALRHRSSAEWLTDLESAGVVAGAVRTYDEVVEREAQRRDSAVIPVGDRLGLRLPVRYQDWDPAASTTPPRLGEHTGLVLSTIVGLTPEEAEAFLAAGEGSSINDPSTGTDSSSD